jgi:hypothetical protein
MLLVHAPKDWQRALNYVERASSAVPPRRNA